MIVGGQVIALAPPDELRRTATNGDLLDIETETMFDVSALTEMPFVREVRQLGPRHFRVVVDDAGSALPVVVDRIQAGGVEVDSAREQRLSFDEIFGILVARHEAEQGIVRDAEGADEDDDRPSPGAPDSDASTSHDGPARPEAAA
jgi:hypothetical protein